jgi:hypothetical protein
MLPINQRIKKPIVLLATGLALLGAYALPESAQSASAGVVELASAQAAQPATGTDCQGVLASVDVAAADVRPFVPTKYALARPTLDPAGADRAEVFVDMVKCAEIRDGTKASRPAHCGMIAIGIETPPGGDPLKRNYYLYSWVTTSTVLRDWARDGTGIGDVVRRVDGLSYDGFALEKLKTSFSFVAPSPAHSPHSGSGDMTPSLVQLTGATLWRETSAGTVRFDTPTNATFGLAFGTISTVPSSALGRMFGGQATKGFSGFSLSLAQGTWNKAVIG